MNNKQKELLKKLAITISGLALECEKDENFNLFISDLGIFKMDLNEAFNEIIDNLED